MKVQDTHNSVGFPPEGGSPSRVSDSAREPRALSAEEVIWCRNWPAWFTVDQMRQQLAHEAAGCPVPFPGAEWDGYCYRGESWPGHSSHTKATGAAQ